MCLLAAHLFKWKTAAISVMLQPVTVRQEPQKKVGKMAEPSLMKQ